MGVRPATHRESARLRRALLVDAAIAVIAERGVGGTTHRAVADRAGLPPSTTTYFFASIDDLVCEALNVVADRAVERVEAVLADVGSRSGTAEEVLDGLVDLLVTSPSAEVRAQIAVYLECIRRPQLQAAAQHILSSGQRLVEASLRMMGVEDTAARAQLVLAVVDGFSLRRQALPGGEADRRELGNALTALYRGFLAVDATR